MTNFWGYIAIFFFGIIAGLVIYIRIKNPDTVINDNQRIGKIKSRGAGSTQTISLIRAATDQVSDQAKKKPLLDRIFPGRELRRVTRKERREARLQAKDPP